MRDILACFVTFLKIIVFIFVCRHCISNIYALLCEVDLTDGQPICNTTLTKTLHKMKQLNFKVLMALEPTKYATMQNQLGQIVDFYEHPLHGYEYPVLAVIEAEKIACNTGFYDCADFYENSEYMPIYMHGTIDCAFNFDL